jgi:hypothetical protein
LNLVQFFYFPGDLFKLKYLSHAGLLPALTVWLLRAPYPDATPGFPPSGALNDATPYDNLFQHQL